MPIHMAKPASSLKTGATYWKKGTCVACGVRQSCAFVHGGTLSVVPILKVAVSGSLGLANWNLKKILCGLDVFNRRSVMLQGTRFKSSRGPKYFCVFLIQMFITQTKGKMLWKKGFIVLQHFEYHMTDNYQNSMLFWLWLFETNKNWCRVSETIDIMNIYNQSFAVCRCVKNTA
jgi:hypothetical protein